MPTKHIVSLLNTHGRVIVPELGAFILKGKLIYFNEFLRFNDGVLIDYIAEQEKIQKDDSAKKVTDFVTKINKQLSTTKSIELEGLGVLIVDSNDKIQLKAQGTVQVEQVSSQAEKNESPREVFFEIEKTEPVTPVKATSKTSKKTKPQTSKSQTGAVKDKEKIEEETPIELEKMEDVTPVKEEKTVQIQSQDQPSRQASASQTLKTSGTDQTVQATQTDQTTQPTKPIQSTQQPASGKSVTPVKPQSSSQVKRQSQVPPPVKSADKSHKGNSKVWLGAFLIVLISIIVYFVFFKNFLKSNNVNQNITIGGKNISDSVVKTADKENNVSEMQVEQVASTETKDKKEKIETPVKELPNVNLSQTNATKQKSKMSAGKRYYLVAGCFSVEANAEKMVQKLISQGFKSEKFKKPNSNMFYVSYSSYASRAEAAGEMDRLKSAGQSNIWILNN
jgi:nucleoid DNA-binding protein